MVGGDDIKKLVLQQKTINESYESIEFLSDSGFFSVVFTARRIQNGAKTVLKFFVNPYNDPYRRAAFNREGELLWTLLKGEDRFVQLVDAPANMDVRVVAGTVDLTLQLPFLAFDWMNGGDAEALAAVGPQNHRELLSRLDTFREMVRGVARLHFLRCFHRDLKPGNFLFDNTPTGRDVKLSDFGTIRSCNGGPSISPEYRDPIGDRRYAAPELFSGVAISDDWNRTADLYSLGAILFQLLTGQELIGSTFGSITQAHEFSQYMKTVPPENRLRAFNEFLDSHGHEIPKVRDINRLVPKCVDRQLDALVEALADFDYRKRDIAMSRVIRSIDICRTILSNEAKHLVRLQSRRAGADAR